VAPVTPPGAGREYPIYWMGMLEGGRLRRWVGPLVGLAVALAGCAQPLPIERRAWVLGQLLAHTAPRADSLVRPRLGEPEIEMASAALSIEIDLIMSPEERLPRAALVPSALADLDAAACTTAPTPGCWPLALVREVSQPLDGRVQSLVTARATLAAGLVGVPEPGGWDLAIIDGAGHFERGRHAVWLRKDDPAALTEIRVAQLSDLHIGKGKGDAIAAHLERVIDELAKLGPDLVVITGDLVESGNRAKLLRQAASVLMRINAPLLIIPGNHDHGFSPEAFGGHQLSDGWAAFAHAFHPSLYFETHLGAWSFVGFDSGPSVFSPFVWTRGLGDTTLQTLRSSLDSAQRGGDRGVVLFSHAPSRARIFGRHPSHAAGPFGRMLWGAAAFERLIHEVASPSFRVLHLSGHTHFSDVFEQDATGAFARWDRKRLFGGPRELSGPAALVNVQSATHTTFRGSARGRGYGFVWLVLRNGAPTLELRRFVD